MVLLKIFIDSSNLEKARSALVLFRLLIILFFSFFLNACSCRGDINFSNFKPKPKGTVRVVTYNVNWGNGDWKIKSHKRTVHTIKMLNADIILLQESTKKWCRLILKSLSKLYHYRHFYRDGNAGGMAILSRYPLHHLKVIWVPNARHAAILADVHTPIGNLQVLNVHLRPPLNIHDGIGPLGLEIWRSSNLHMKELRYLYQQLDPNKKIIIAGDFNEGSRGHAYLFLRRHDYVDALWYDKSAADTWCWKWMFIMFSGHLDHMFFRPGVLYPQQVQVLHEGNSDHFPIVVDYAEKIFLK
jgi:endonuclease/exonuclease/phosphatase family metal-dependent hydrolase